MKRWMLNTALLLSLSGVAFGATNDKPVRVEGSDWGVPLFASALEPNDWLVCVQRCDSGKYGCIAKDQKSKESVARCEKQVVECKTTCDKTYKH